MKTNLPTGTVTFLFTDIEGSTQLWEKHPETMKAALASHDAVLRAAIESHGGYFIKSTGDGALAVFEKAPECIAAMLAAQHNFLEALEGVLIKVRMGAHSGEAELRGEDYHGQTLNRAARLMSAGHGGQILVSNATRELIRDKLPANIALLDLGEHRLKDLSRPEHIYQVTAPGLPAEFPPIQWLDSFPNNLPLQLTSFVGREKEIAEIKALVATTRLVTLTGSGGTGKTRLSLQVGTDFLAAFSNGVWLIELAPLTDPAQIILALAQVFGLQEVPGSSLATLVSDYLRDKKMLLLMDNCEHLIAACARLADDLLHQCAGLKILASSREALGITGEVAYRTPSLGESESMRLFMDRAYSANPKLSLGGTAADSVAQICARLDGIPLAIELAAARTKLLSVDQIAARLDDLFRLLVGGSRTALPRQQTLRALIDWSYDLLSAEEKQLMRTASVFVGGWTLDAIEAISDDADAIEHLEGLVNKSLVVTEERNAEMRYFMLETIRQYAREKVFEAKESLTVRDQHFLYFDRLGEKLWEVFRSPEMLAWRGKAGDELKNLRAALEWGMERHGEHTLNLAANFCVAASWLGAVAETLGSLKAALNYVRSLSPLEGEANLERQKRIAKALFVQGMAGLSGSGLPEVMQSLQEAIAISRLTGDKLILGYSLEMYFAASQFKQTPDALAAAEEGLALLTEINDHWGVSFALNNMVRVASMRGDQAGKQKYFQQAKERIRDTPPSFEVGNFYLVAGYEERFQGNFELAKQHFEAGLANFRRLRNKNFENAMSSELGHIARLQGDFPRAKEIYRQTILGWQELGARPAIANQLECFAAIAASEAEPRRAAKLFGAAETLRTKAQSPMADYEQKEYNQAVSQMRGTLSEAEVNALWAEGQAMTMEQAIRFARGEDV